MPNSNALNLKDLRAIKYESGMAKIEHIIVDNNETHKLKLMLDKTLLSRVVLNKISNSVEKNIFNSGAIINNKAIAPNR